MVIHVFNYNHDERLLTFSHVDVTAAEICEEIANIEQVKDDSRDVFSLWIIGEGLGSFARSALHELTFCFAFHPCRAPVPPHR